MSARRGSGSRAKRRPSRRSSAPELVIRGAQTITMDPERPPGRWDLAIRDGRIVNVASKISTRGAQRVIDAKGMIALPGLVQGHLHLCQTLGRGLADGLQLLEWLQQRIWPLEGALTASDLRASARLAMAELLLGGTTSVLDMGTVRHTDVLFEEAKRFGLRYTGGKTIMDAGQGYPASLRETTEDALRESNALCDRWHGTANGRLRYAFSPRFALSCSEEALRQCVRDARRHGARLHTHAAESAEELELLRSRVGAGNVQYLHRLGFTGPDVVLAHGIWLSTEERRLLRETRTRVVHCPSSNLKLASGIARLPEMLKEEISVALGADGAPCNNGLDAFWELRLTALIHNVRQGPTAIPAATALALATRDGARALGLEDVGTLAEGKQADIVLLDGVQPHTYPPAADLISRVVFSARSSDVRTVVVGGRVVVDDGVLQGLDLKRILSAARKAGTEVTARLGATGSS